MYLFMFPPKVYKVWSLLYCLSHCWNSYCVHALMIICITIILNCLSGKFLISISLISISGNLSYFLGGTHSSVSLFSMILCAGLGTLGKIAIHPILGSVVLCRRWILSIYPAWASDCFSSLCNSPSHFLCSWWLSVVECVPRTVSVLKGRITFST